MREGTAERHNQAHLRGQTSCLKVSHFVVCFSICLAVHMYGAAKAAKAGLTKSMAFDLPFLLSVVFCVSVVTDQSDLTLPETARGIVLFAHGSGRGAVGLARAIAMWHGSTRGSLDRVGRSAHAGRRGNRLQTAHLRFDIELLAERLVDVTEWLAKLPETRDLRASITHNFCSDHGAKCDVGQAR
jgi:hypothetical protein